MNDKEIKENLAASYQILAMLHMDDLTYTHLSARSADGDSFYIYPFGSLFEEVTASSLLKVNHTGKIIEGEEYQYNQTGYVIHGSIYQKRPEINAVFHMHTPAGVAVSASVKGLKFISQFSFHFYENLSYHNYDSLALASESGNDLATDLKSNSAMILRNHGTLTCGSTIREAFFYAYYLEQACKVQCALGSEEAILIDPAICKKACNDMRNFEQDLGKRDWLALLRKLERHNSNYKA